MTIEERLNSHEQFLASLERNVAALVEAQQRTDHGVSRLEQTVSGLAQVVDGSLAGIRELTGMVHHVIEAVDGLAQRQIETDAKLGRLADTVQKFLAAQLRRNGGD